MKCRLAFASNPARLKEVRRFVRKFLEAANCDGPAAERIVLGIQEACTNAIRHTYASRPDKTLRLTCEATARQFRFRLRDYGPHFVFDHPPARSTQVLAPGGLGLPLILHTFESVAVVHHPRGNELVLTCPRKHRRLATNP